MIVDHLFNNSQDGPIYANTIPYRYGGEKDETASYQIGSDYTLTSIGFSLLRNMFGSVVGDTVQPQEAKELYGVDIESPSTRERVRFKAYHTYLREESERAATIMNGRGGWSRLGAQLMGSIADPVMILGMAGMMKLGGVAVSKFPSFGETMSVLTKTGARQFATVGTANALFDVSINKSFFTYLDEDYGVKEGLVDFGLNFVLGGALHGALSLLRKGGSKMANANINRTENIRKRLQEAPDPESAEVLKGKRENVEGEVAKQILKIAEESPSEFKTIIDADYRETMQSILDAGLDDSMAMEAYMNVRYAVDNGIDVNLKPVKKMVEKGQRKPSAVEDFGPTEPDFNQKSPVALISLKGQKQAVKKFGAVNYFMAGVEAMRDSLEASLNMIEAIDTNITRKAADKYIELITFLESLKGASWEDSVDSRSIIESFNTIHKKR